MALDSTVELMAEKGIRFLPLVHGSARWAAGGYPDPPELGAWRRWLTALASRYQGRAEFWEIWNEPDIGFFGGTVEEYIEMQRVAYAAIKSVAPDEIVATGGFTHLGHGQVKPGIYEATLAEYPAAFDLFAYHRHGTFADFYRDQHVLFADLRRRTRTEGMPIVFTETGMDTRYGQRHQAETLLKKMTYASASGAKAYTWYNLMDRAGGEQSTRPGHTYGLLTNPTGTGNFAEIEDRIRPKEALVAAAAAVRELRGRPHLETWAQDGRRFAFLFGDPGDYLVVSWLEDERTPEAIWIIGGGIKQATSLDLFGNPSPMPVVGGHALITIGDPRYYRFVRGQTAPPLVHPLVTTPDRVSPGPDGEVILNFELRNPLDRQITVHAELNAGDFTILDRPPARTLDAGGAVTLPIRLAVGEGRFGEVKAFEIQLRFEGLPWAPTMRVPVSFNTIHAGPGHRLGVSQHPDQHRQREPGLPGVQPVLGRVRPAADPGRHDDRRNAIDQPQGRGRRVRTRSQVPFWRMHPEPDLVKKLPDDAGANVLSEPNGHCVVQLIGGAAGATLHLNLPSGRWAVRWIDPASGREVSRAEATAGPNGLELTIPGESEHRVIHLNRKP